MAFSSFDVSALPLADRPVTDEQIQQELEQLAQGILPPKLNFARLRKTIIDPAMFELGFARQGIGYWSKINDFIACVDIMRDKSNRAFRLDLGFQPAATGDLAALGEWPAAASIFRGSISFPDGLCWWVHGLEEPAARDAMAQVVGYLKSDLLAGLQQVVEFCETATVTDLENMPLWLWQGVNDAVVFARYRHAAGRAQEAVQFARSALAKLAPAGALAHLQPPSALEQEMRELAQG